MGSLCIHSVEIKAIAASIPPNIVPLSGESSALFTPEDIDRIKVMTGINQRVVSSKDVCASDLMTDAAAEVLHELNWRAESVDLIVVVTQSGDYPLPATSCIIQKNLGLSKECLAFDVGLGCSGYTYGLSIVGSMMQSGNIKRALLLAGDTSTWTASPNDRSTALLFGDVGTATALEFNGKAADRSNAWSFVGGSDGEGYCHLIIKDGGSRNPISRDAKLDSSVPSGLDLHMDGGEVFKFTIEVVPKLIKDTLQFAERAIESVDYFIMHQANLFLLKHLAKKMKIPPEKMPLTLDRYGNTSSASIPLTIVDSMKDQLNGKSVDLMLVGFGVGYSWGSIHVPIRNSVICIKKQFERYVKGRNLDEK